MPQRHCFSVWFASVVLLSSTGAADQATYQDDVRPILREHCFACHNQDDATAGLVLDSFDGLTTGGASGEVVAAGDPDGSRLWKLVSHQEEPNMPPGDKLSDNKLQVIRSWIEGGLRNAAGSQPLRSNKPAIAKLDATRLGEPAGQPVMPEQLFHEPVLWRPRPGPIDALATSPWAPLAAIAWQRQVSFYNTNSYELLGIVPYVDGVPRVVRFSRDGSLALVAGGRQGAAGSASLYDVKTGARLTRLGDELDIVLAADISPDLSMVAIGGPRKIVRVYHVADGSLAYQLGKHTDWITALGFSPDGRLLASADRSGGALLWQATAGHERAELRGHERSISALDWRRDAALVATASEDGTVRLWNQAGKPIKSFEAHKRGVLSIRFARDGNLVTAGRDSQVKTWNSDGGALAELDQLPGIALAAAFAHDGTKVLASDYTGEVRVIDTAGKQQLATLPANPPLLAQRLDEADRVWKHSRQQLYASEARLQAQLTKLEQGIAAHAAHESQLAAARIALETEGAQQAEQARDESQTAAEKQQTAQQRLSVAAAALAAVEAAAEALPDLVQLAEQHEQVASELAAAAEKLEQAQQSKQQIAAQQARFAAAGQKYANEVQLLQSEQQELAQQSKRLAAEHQSAASKLHDHRVQRAAVASGLQTMEAKLAELTAAETTFEQQEAELAAQLGKIRAALATAERQAARLAAGKRDFLTAQQLRMSYLNANQ